MAALIIEISSRGRGQPQYRRVRNFPYRIGRAYDNDLILHDETVSAHHLHIEHHPQLGFCVRNLSRENGSECHGRTLGFVPEPITPGTTLTLGHTQVRLLAPDTRVAPAKRSHHYPGPMQLASKLPVALGLLIWVWVIHVWLLSQQALPGQSAQHLLLSQWQTMLSPLLAATLTGFISRLLLHRWQFALQLSIASLATLLLTFSDATQQWLSYYYSDYEAGQTFLYLMLASVFTGLFAWQLRAFSNLSHRRAMATAVAIAWPFLLLSHLQVWQRTPEFSEQPLMHTQLHVQDEREKKDLSLDRFIETVQHDLQPDIDVE